MTMKPDMPVCILAGGTASRFGGNKALAELCGKPMLSHVLDRIKDQTSAEVAINANDARAFDSFNLRVVPDTKWKKAGPLAGIYAALDCAREEGFVSVVTVAVDLPFLPENFLSEIAKTGPPAIAASQGRWHPVNGIWSVKGLSDLDAYLASGKRSAHGWAETCKAEVVEFTAAASDPDPFWNVNTQDDLLRAGEQLEGAQRN